MESNKSEGYLVFCSYAIGIVDLVSAVLFAGVSGIQYAQHQHWTAIVALIFSILWISIILTLLQGVRLRYLTYVRYWLVFTCLGIMLDSLLLLYGLTLNVSIDWEGVKITLLPFAGLAVEMTFVYIIYVLYLDLIDRELWIPLTTQRSPGGCTDSTNKDTNSSSEAQRKERRRLRKMSRREQRAAQREQQRKLNRSKV